MPRKRPEFTNSPYFVDEPGNWHLKSDAPEELQIEFEQYMQSLEDIDVQEQDRIEGIRIRYPW